MRLVLQHAGSASTWIYVVAGEHFAKQPYAQVNDARAAYHQHHQQHHQEQQWQQAQELWTRGTNATAFCARRGQRRGPARGLADPGPGPRRALGRAHRAWAHQIFVFRKDVSAAPRPCSVTAPASSWPSTATPSVARLPPPASARAAPRPAPLPQVQGALPPGAGRRRLPPALVSSPWLNQETQQPSEMLGRVLRPAVLRDAGAFISTTLRLPT